MIDNLNFVKGAAQKKSLLPVLSHFCIRDGRITGSDGVITLSAPCDLSIETYPKAVPFVLAVNACKGKDIQLSMTPGGKLRVKSGKTSATVECSQEVYPELQPEGQLLSFTGDFMGALAMLRPFIGTNQQQAWSTGVLIRGNTLTVTNNVTLLEYTAADQLSPVPVNIPAVCLDEMLRIGEMPVSFQLSDRSISFHYPDGRWIRSPLLAIEWPPVEQILDQPINNSYQPDAQFFSDLKKLAPFADSDRRVFISPHFMASHADPSTGCRIECSRELHAAILNIDQVMKLKPMLESIDLSYYPKPCPFVGDSVRGVLTGVRFNG